jgi:hypothetical protein
MPSRWAGSTPSIDPEAVAGLIQERDAVRVVDALLGSVRVKSRVFRDGSVISIAAEEEVAGDVVLLVAGDVVPSDRRVPDANVEHLATRPVPTAFERSITRFELLLVRAIAVLVAGILVVNVLLNHPFVDAPALALTVGVIGVGNGRRCVLVRDLAIVGRPTVLVWSKRTGRWREPLCERASWSEISLLIRPRSVLIERAGLEICGRVGEDLDLVAEVAR